jgi:hypothetical protein
MTEDPIGFAGGLTKLTGYCGNDPVNYVDPSGLETDECGRGYHLDLKGERHYHNDPLDNLGRKLDNGGVKKTEVQEIIDGLKAARERIASKGGPHRFRFGGAVCTECEYAVSRGLSFLTRKSDFEYSQVVHWGPLTDPLTGAHLGPGDHVWGEIKNKRTGEIFTIDFWGGGMRNPWRKGQDPYGWGRNDPPAPRHGPPEYWFPQF